jgi:hypothetical protein
MCIMQREGVDRAGAQKCFARGTSQHEPVLPRSRLLYSCLLPCRMIFSRTHVFAVNRTTRSPPPVPFTDCSGRQHCPNRPPGGPKSPLSDPLTHVASGKHTLFRICLDLYH